MKGTTREVKTKKNKKKPLSLRVLAEEHHRRCTSLDGKNEPFNKSYITPEIHHLWHIIAGNLNAMQFTELLNKHTPNPSIKNAKPTNVVLECGFINGSPVVKSGGNATRKKENFDRVWLLMFEDMNSFEDTIAYINYVLLDPSYHIYCIKQI
jgi:hypothetical protein